MAIGSATKTVAAIGVAALALAVVCVLFNWATAGFFAIIIVWFTYWAVRGIQGGRPLLFRRRRNRARYESKALGDVAGFGEQLRDTTERYGYARSSSS